MKILGVKYIGLKDSQEDTVCGSGAFWKPDQVLNFDEDAANKLLVHSDSFVLAELSPSANIYGLKKQNAVNEIVEPLGYYNMNAMDLAELSLFAKRHLNMVVDQGRSIEESKAMIQAKLSLDARYDPQGETVSDYVISKTVTKQEFEAYQAGELVLQLVTAEVDEATLEKDLATLRATFNEIDVKTAESVEPTVSTHAIESVLDAEKVEQKEDLPTLPELLASLSTKKELQDFAKENKVSYANSMTEAQLRAKLLREVK